MNKSDFFYSLPEELIAQTPIEPRDASRLMVINKLSEEMKNKETATIHKHFYNLVDFINKGDLLVLNNSKVFPARLFADNSEVLLLEAKEQNIWECIGTKLKKGKKLAFGKDLEGEVLEVLKDGNRLIKFYYNGDFYEILNKIGNMPLPHYITEKLENKSRYNTIYADEAGSAAAPTAGLHFTERVFESLAEKGADTAYVTLHVGLGTFRPVKSDNILEHKMHAERYFMPEETAQKIADCKKSGNRVIAVGTTSCRTLEASAGKTGSGSTDIFIYPGYKFKVTSGLLTNFHLPESTLIMLVSAFLGRENTLKAYEEAIREKYRFFSFGDAMLIT